MIGDWIVHCFREARRAHWQRYRNGAGWPEEQMALAKLGMLSDALYDDDRLVRRAQRKLAEDDQLIERALRTNYGKDAADAE